MTVRFFDRSHAPYVPVKPRAYMVELVEDDPELFIPCKVEKPGHVKIDDIEAGPSVV